LPLTLLVIAGLALLLRADAGSIAGFDPSDFAIAVGVRRPGHLLWPPRSPAAIAAGPDTPCAIC